MIQTQGQTLCSAGPGVADSRESILYVNPLNYTGYIIDTDDGVTAPGYNRDGLEVVNAD